MKLLLKEEYDAFLACYEQPPLRGVRLNTLKCTKEKLCASLPFQLLPTPFSPLSFYAPEAEHVGSLAMHHAGAFYSQEPSAASAVSVLSPQPGDRVLDLCAAPGGKSTQIAALLCGTGLLWSNELIKSRANILLSNIERMGVRNAVVSSCHPQTLCEGLAGYFDKVLVDAPCSGEGMFRRDTQAAADWSEEHVYSCAARQRAILDSAALALRPGGTLVYSTCTFSAEENEQVVSAFLSCHPEFQLEDSGVSFGRPGLLEYTRRIFPMDGGEGHFVAKLLKNSGSVFCGAPFVYQCAGGEGEAFCREVYAYMPEGNLTALGKRLYLLPKGLPALEGLGVLRSGILLGEMKPGRVEPAHALFQAARLKELNHVLDYACGSQCLGAFLRGEELEAPETVRGWTGVAADGVLTGFGKCSGGRLKNHYPKGLRANF